jgi:UDP-N-acetylmuramate dehydrogenase
MDRHTTFRIGGPADRFVVPRDTEDFQTLLQETPEEEKITVVGAGSNLLVQDGGLRGTVVHTKSLDWVRVETNRASVGAGVQLPGLLRKLSRRGLGGLEGLAGIPGTVGGAVRMNAGTPELCMADRLLQATLLHRSGRVEQKKRDALNFGYRFMDLPENTWITGAELQCDPGDPAEIEEAIKKRWAERNQKQPWSLPSAGSIFKNPPGDHAGRLIEESGMKGARVGDAEVSTVHANFIVNHGKARAADVLALIKKVRKNVEHQFGVHLELEIRIVGEPA